MMDAPLAHPSKDPPVVNPTPADRTTIQQASLIQFPDRNRLGVAPPVPLTSFVGREREVETLVALLRREHVRFVTLTGPGGVGKTRLAIQTATAVADAFPDGVWFVKLAPVRQPALVASTIAQTLGVQEKSARSFQEGIQEFLRDRRSLLLLDNFEHLLDAAPLIGELLSACPSLTVLVTSRTVLRVSGEHDVAVPPLGLPDPHRQTTLDEVIQTEAVRLFADRAQAARNGFVLTEDNVGTVAE